MPADVEAMEEALRRISGVVSARIFEKDGELSEVHVLSSGLRRPKQVARDVESLLAAQFGVEIDHRRISVALLDPRDGDEPRLVYDYVSLTSRDGGVEVEVGLKLGDSRYVGTAKGPGSARSRRFLVAEATLEAARSAAAEKGAGVAVADVGQSRVGGSDVMVVLVAFSSRGIGEPLVGAAYVRADESEAVVRATLSALNRKFALIL